MIDFEATRRLWDALEASRLVPGEGLASTSCSPVPDEVAKAFRDLMEAPVEAPDGVTSIAAAANAQPTASPIDPALAPEGVQGVSNASAASDVPGTSPSARPEHIDSLERPPQLNPADAVTMSPTELYRLQVSVNMHALETHLMTGVRERTASELESAVKSTN